MNKLTLIVTDYYKCVKVILVSSFTYWCFMMQDSYFFFQIYLRIVLFLINYFVA